jgi:hypothetical protein
MIQLANPPLVSAVILFSGRNDLGQGQLRILRMLRPLEITDILRGPTTAWPASWNPADDLISD